MSKPTGFLSELTKIFDARSARFSSWDQKGGNRDNWVIAPGESAILAEIDGPGCITHIWMTQTCRIAAGPGWIPPEQTGVPMLEIHNALGVNWETVDDEYYRKIVLKIFWDDQIQPSVITPLGDFFGLMNSLSGNYSSLPLSVSVKDSENLTFGGSASFNSYFQMPFNSRARIEVENQNNIPYIQYFHIDYELYKESLPIDIGYFHSYWSRSESDSGWGSDIQVNTAEIASTFNTSEDNNYEVLNIIGRGHYVGCNLAVRHLQGSWWGEGDEMISIDDDTWPPSIHGTGSEDYFGHAWGMQHNAFPMCGSIIHESDVPGFQHSYRFHISDPVRFQKRIRVSIEHGHNNHLSDDWSSTAYWYQSLPSPLLHLAKMEERLPLREKISSPKKSKSAAGTQETAASIAYEKRKKEFIIARDAFFFNRAQESKVSSLANIAHGKKIRQRFDKS
jgi:hypothetical protein